MMNLKDKAELYRRTLERIAEEGQDVDFTIPEDVAYKIGHMTGMAMQTLKSLDNDTITLVRLNQTCNACPSQWEAWDADGTEYYIRYRWGNLTVNRGGVQGEFIFDEQIGDGLDGFMNTEDMLAHTGMKYIPQ